MFKTVKEKAAEVLELLFSKGRRLSSQPKQAAITILVTVALAFLLWFVVNLNRSYTVDIKVPLTLGQVSSNRALAQALPKYVTASVSGEGWYLLSVYRDPSPIFIEVSDEQVNLFEQVRRQFQTTSKLRVQKVDPLYLRLRLEEKVTKKVPVFARIETKFAPQYNFLTSPTIKPDSVTITGAASIVDDINYWLTDSLTINKIDESFSLEIPLKKAGPLITLSEQGVEFTAEAAQFTEGSVIVPVELRDASVGQNVIFSPKEIEITYLVPIHEFPVIKEGNIYAAYVTYNQLLQDTTGFVSPQIEQLTDNMHLKVQQVQPRQVAYFNIVSGAN